MENKTIKVSMTGIPNCGVSREETKEFTIEIKNNSIANNISIKDSKGKHILSFAPFFDGGSMWVDSSSLIIDLWDVSNEDPAKWRVKESISTNAFEIDKWRKDSVELEKIRQAFKLIKGGLNE